MPRWDLIRERACCDPKDGELCLNRAKPKETLMKARSDSDVQIDSQILEVHSIRPNKNKNLY